MSGCGCGVTMPPAPQPEPAEPYNPEPYNPVIPDPTSHIKPSYLVTFITENSTVIDVIRVEHGQDATPPQPPNLPGLIFMGWLGNMSDITDHTLIKATYALDNPTPEPPPEYTVTFLDSTGATIHVVTVFEGMSAQPPVPPNSPCYFAGWNGRYWNVFQDEIVIARCMPADYVPPIIPDLGCPPVGLEPLNPEPPIIIEPEPQPEPVHPEPQPAPPTELSMLFDLTYKESNGTTLRLPMVDFTGTIRWGDGTIKDYTGANQPTHTYNAQGEFLVMVSGFADHWDRVDTDDISVLRNILTWGDTFESRFYGALPDDPSSGNGMLANRQGFTIGATDVPTFSNGDAAMGMFYNCYDFNGDISHWDVSVIERFDYFFYRAMAFNQDIGKWDVTSAISTVRMFSGAIAFNQDIGQWLTPNVNTMEAMFITATAFNQDISMWNIASVRNMDNMFYGAQMFTQDLSAWQAVSIDKAVSFFTHDNSSLTENKHPTWGYQLV